MNRFPFTWRTMLYAFMGIVWLAVGIGRLHRGDSGFTPLGAIFNGLCWFSVAFLWRPKPLR